MTDHTSFFRNSEAMMALYSKGKYLDALKVNEQIALEFPDEAPTTSLWRIRLLSRADRVDDALKAMLGGLGKGLWWLEEQLRSEEDLAPWQGLQVFEGMIAEFRAVYRKGTGVLISIRSANEHIQHTQGL